MKVVFQDYLDWGNKPHAERELGLRMENAARAIGVESLFTADIGKIEKFKPDIVFPLHHFTPKLFDAYTVGCMWNPIDYILEATKEEKFTPLENIKSYDAFAVSSTKVKDFLDVLGFKSPFKRDLYTIYPSSMSSECNPVSEFKKIAYIGSNWQLDRHRDLFLNSNKIAVYGPHDKWTYVIEGSDNYYGEVPFGSDHVRNVYRENGIGLCFHGEKHLKDNIPNMRIFEMASAGIVVFADKLPFIEEAFGDSVKYIDISKDTKTIIEQIDYEYNWVLENKSKAREMASNANKIFNEKFTLEKQLKDIFHSYKKGVSDVNREQSNKSVEIIVRTDGNRGRLKETVQSFSDQTHKNIIVKFVYWGNDKEKFENRLEEIVPKNLKYQILEMKGRKDRSYNLYHGIRTSEADFVAICDDDDVLFKNHVSSLVEMLEQDKELAVAYSGVIMDEMTKKGSRRELFFFHDFIDFESKSYITSNSYLIRRRSLPYQIFSNEIPNISTGEDRMLLDLIHFNGGKFSFSEKATSVFFRDSIHSDNISSDIKEWERNRPSYIAFLNKSALEKNYLSRDDKGKKEKKENVGKAGIVKKIMGKLIPFRVRRFILLLVKQLVESSKKV
ncbi:MAG: glycosyltransferase [Candidatus Dojkabacteria bacterium]|jgi:hypothetical protein